MHNFNDIKKVAKGKWAGILIDNGVDPVALQNRHGPCPVCGGKDRFRFDDKDGEGTHICGQCGAGDGFALLMKVFCWTFPQAVDAVAQYLGIHPSDTPSVLPQLFIPTKKSAPNQNRQQRIESVLAGSQRMNWPIVRYFKNRGLSGLAEKVPDCLRCHSGLPYWEETEPGIWQQTSTCPAMLGIVTDLAGNLITLHRTYITIEGHKAPFPSPKKLMAPSIPGSLRGCSIKLGMPVDTLYLTEGIETGLAVMLSTGGAVWVCISTGLLVRVKIPKFVTQVYIMADLDHSGAGEESARKLAFQLLRERGSSITIKVCLPPGPIPEGQKSLDWLDFYQTEKKEGAV